MGSAMEQAAAQELEPLEIASLLAEEWGEAFRHANDGPRADFWDLQRQTLHRLVSKLEGGPGEGRVERLRRMLGGGEPARGSDVSGMVVRVHRPHKQTGMDFGI